MSFLIFIAVLIISIAYNSSHDSNLPQKYKNLVVNQNQVSISEIAKQLGRPSDLVSTDIHTMLISKNIIDAHIDRDTNCIVYHDGRTPSSFLVDNSAPADVQCSNCGALNVSSEKNCEYCGSPLR